MHEIGDSINKLLKLPSTFDGSLMSDTFRRGSPRIVIGNTYCFGDPNAGVVVGEVTYASVDEQSSQALIAITDTNGVAHILREPMSPEQLHDYRVHKDSYFGKILPVGGRIDSPIRAF